ncbi:hypothetical protein [Streptomyces venezuelae]
MMVKQQVAAGTEVDRSRVAQLGRAERALAAPALQITQVREIRRRLHIHLVPAFVDQV